MHKGEKLAMQDDRREYFRVNDTVRVSLRVVPEDQLDRLDERLEQIANGGFTVMSSLAAISSEMAVSMRRIEHSEPDIATYLKALDRKIEVLGRAMIAGETGLIEEPAHPVNLSAGGIGILLNEEYESGQVLELRMLLFPSMTGVATFGTVVDCQPVEAADNEGYRFHLRLAFTHLREQDRDLLIRHALRCQSHELRQRERDNDGE